MPPKTAEEKIAIIGGGALTVASAVGAGYYAACRSKDFRRTQLGQSICTPIPIDINEEEVGTELTTFDDDEESSEEMSLEEIAPSPPPPPAPARNPYTGAAVPPPIFNFGSRPIVVREVPLSPPEANPFYRASPPPTPKHPPAQKVADITGTSSLLPPPPPPESPPAAPVLRDPEDIPVDIDFATNAAQQKRNDCGLFALAQAVQFARDQPMITTWNGMINFYVSTLGIDIRKRKYYDMCFDDALTGYLKDMKHVTPAEKMLVVTSSAPEAEKMEAIKKHSAGAFVVNLGNHFVTMIIVDGGEKKFDVFIIDSDLRIDRKELSKETATNLVRFLAEAYDWYPYDL